MSGFESITIREVESSGLETFYEHQLDPEAIRMAAFLCEDPKDKVAFDAHWNKIWISSQITQRTIVAEGQVAGHIACLLARVSPLTSSQLDALGDIRYRRDTDREHER